MSLKNRFLIRIAFLLIGVLFSFKTFAAKPGWSIEVRGTVTSNGNPLPGTVVSLFCDSVLLQKATSPDGDFSFVLHADTEYMLLFPGRDMLQTA